MKTFVLFKVLYDKSFYQFDYLSECYIPIRCQ